MGSFANPGSGLEQSTEQHVELHYSLLDIVMVGRSSLSPEKFAFPIAKAGPQLLWIGELGPGGIIQLTYN